MGKMQYALIGSGIFFRKADPMGPGFSQPVPAIVEKLCAVFVTSDCMVT